MSIKTPTIIIINGHHWAMSGPRRGSQPKLDRRKMTPKTIKMYAPNRDLAFIKPPK
jgi:hypothetical protein